MTLTTKMTFTYFKTSKNIVVKEINTLVKD